MTVLTDVQRLPRDDVTGALATLSRTRPSPYPARPVNCPARASVVLYVIRRPVC